MSGQTLRTHERGSSGPLIVNRDPIVVERTPAATSHRRTASETANPGARRTFRVYNPFSRRNRDTNVVIETTTTTVTRPRGGGLAGDTSGSPPVQVRRVRRSSPPPPPVIVHRRTRSLSPSQRIRMPPSQGQSGYVPLPPRISPDERLTSEQRDRGRSGQEARRSQVVEGVQIIDADPPRRRSPRPHQQHRSRVSDPRNDAERVLEPLSPRPHFEVVQPNETVRSRPRSNEVRASREYIELKAVADHNKEAAKEAAQRCASAEVRLQNAQRQLAESQVRENKAVEQSDKLRHETTDLKRELERMRIELDICRHEHRITNRERDAAEQQLDQERQQRLERARERQREEEEGSRRDSSGNGNSNSNGGRRHRRRVVVTQDRGDRRDDEPRTPRTAVDPRASTTSTAAQATGDSGMEAINRARAEATGRDRIFQR